MTFQSCDCTKWTAEDINKININKRPEADEEMRMCLSYSLMVQKEVFALTTLDAEGCVSMH